MRLTAAISQPVSLESVSFVRGSRHLNCYPEVLVHCVYLGNCLKYSKHSLE